MIYIPVVLHSGEKRTVDKEEFQFLLISDQILSFKRSTGWVVVGQDRMRRGTMPYCGKERRNKELYTEAYWH